MTKSRRLLFDTGLVTNWNTICKKFVFFSCTTRDLRSQIGT